MATHGDIRCVTIEFLRFGGEEAILGKGNRYIRTAGYDETVSEIEAGLSQKDFIRNLARLRYRKGTEPEQANEARKFLATHAANFLPDTLLSSGNGLLQIDVVTKAAELWAFPFEAWLAEHPEKLDHPDEGVVITRRIRGDFSADSPPWPDIPKVLFVHAPVASDLEQSLIDQHTAALCTALGPWAAGGDPIKKGLLTVREVWSEEDLKDAVKVQLYSVIHILAHGAEVRGDVAEDRVWGLRLGSPA